MSEQDEPKRKKEPRLVWIDMEMTGLDPKTEGIIEIASIITDKDLNIVAEGPHLVIHQSPKLLGAMDSWNMKQHKKSGLLEEVKKSEISVDQAEKITLDFIKMYCVAKQSPLCGNSIHHDRRFLEKYMPKIHDFLHYRHVDVSTLKALIRYWYSDQETEYKKKGTHRALEDIRESIEELQFFRKKYFKSRRRLS